MVRGSRKMLHSLVDFFLAVGIGLAMTGAHLLLFVELGLMIGIVALAGRLRGVLTGA